MIIFVQFGEVLLYVQKSRTLALDKKSGNKEGLHKKIIAAHALHNADKRFLLSPFDNRNGGALFISPCLGEFPVGIIFA